MDAVTSGMHSIASSSKGSRSRIPGARTTANFHDVMGLRPVLGRLYTAAHEQAGSDSVQHAVTA